MIASACIVGAGVAGLVTGVALEHRGVTVRVCEQASDLRSLGGALTIWSGAIRALRTLGLDGAVNDAGAVLTEMQFRARNGRLLHAMPVEAPSARHGARTVVIPRSDLLTILAGALSTPVAFGRRYASHRAGARGISVDFADQEPIAADLLVAADGARSTVRRTLGVAEPSFPTGQIIWVGRSRVTHPELVPGVPVVTLGRGLRFFAAPVREDDVHWYAIVQTKHRAATRAHLEGLFEDFAEPVPSLIAAVDPMSLRFAELLDQTPTPGWTGYSTALIGDAAHCSRPDIGQGACQAIESAVVLAACLSRHENVQRALREYELFRFPRTAHVGLLGRVVAFNAMLEDPVLSTLRDLGMAHLFPWIARPGLEWTLRGTDGC